MKLKVTFSMRHAPRLLVSTAATALAAAWPCVAAAEEPPGPRDADVVVTGTRTPERSQRSTVRVDTVTREEAERRGATNVAEALASQPGVQVNPGAYGFLGNVSPIQIQGFDRDRVLVLEDGERVVGDFGGAIDLASLPVADLKRIEIVTGPTSSLYGSSAIGGVVNILTSPPTREGPSGRARLEGRSYRGVVGQGNAAYRSGDTWVGTDVNFNRMDGIARTPGLPDLTLPEIQRSMVGLRAGTKLTDRVDVRVRGRWFRDRTDGLESQLAPGLGRYLIDLPQQTDRYTLHFIETLDLGKGSNLRLTLGRQQFDNETSKDRRASPLDETRRRDHRMQSAEAILTLAEGKTRTWVFGTRFETERFHQDLTRTESRTGGALATVQEEEVPSLGFGSAAVYGQLGWNLTDSFTVMPGVRSEFHTRYGEALAPRLATSYRPSKTFQVRASAGRGFRAPSAKELGFVFDHSFYGYRIGGNRDLLPEKSWGANADVTMNPTSDIVLRGGAFANWVEDLIDVDLAGGTTTGTVSSYSYRNFGSARTAGFQVSGAARMTDRFRAEVGYDYLWTRDDVNDRPLGGRPPHTVTCSLLATLPAGVEAYGRFRVVSDAFLDGTSRAPGYSSLDGRVGHALWPKSQLYAGVVNAGDVRQEPGRLGDTRPPLGRVVYIGLRAELPWEDEKQP